MTPWQDSTVVFWFVLRFESYALLKQTDLPVKHGFATESPGVRPGLN